MSDATNRALADVIAERERQDARFGKQDHDTFQWLAILVEEAGKAAQAANKEHWGIGHPDRYRDAMVSVAAVAIAAVECFDEERKEAPCPA